MPWASSIGTLINNESHGNTSQKILLASMAAFSVSRVPTYNQAIASTDISGTEASMPPVTELRLDMYAIASINPV